MDRLLKSKFGKQGPKIKISSDLPETLYTSQLEGAEHKFEIDSISKH